MEVLQIPENREQKVGRVLLLILFAMGIVLNIFGPLLMVAGMNDVNSGAVCTAGWSGYVGLLLLFIPVAILLFVIGIVFTRFSSKRIAVLGIIGLVLSAGSGILWLIVSEMLFPILYRG